MACNQWEKKAWNAGKLLNQIPHIHIFEYSLYFPVIRPIIFKQLSVNNCFNSFHFMASSFNYITENFVPKLTKWIQYCCRYSKLGKVQNTHNDMGSNSLSPFPFWPKFERSLKCCCLLLAAFSVVNWIEDAFSHWVVLSAKSPSQQPPPANRSSVACASTYFKF